MVTSTDLLKSMISYLLQWAARYRTLIVKESMTQYPCRQNVATDRTLTVKEHYAVSMATSGYQFKHGLLKSMMQNG